jgi:gluconolactonase
MFENIKPIQIAGGFQSPEGPSFDRHGMLHFLDWDARTIYKVTLDGQVTPFVFTGGIPTGSKFHQDGRLFVADGELGIMAINTDGNFYVIANTWEGGKFSGPNDLIFNQHGELYFTDPRGSDAEHPIGNVFLLHNDGRVEKFAGDFRFPNGITLSEDGKTLYLAETISNHILAFELDQNGHEKSRYIFASLQGGLGPDGMAFGQDGNLYVAHFGKGVIAVINYLGKLIAEIPAGGMKPTNLAFWDRSLFVTEVEHSQVVRLDIDVRGMSLYGLS